MPFITSVTPGGRHFLDETSDPLFVNAEIAWFINSQLSVAQQMTYFADRQAKGFNAVLVAWFATGVNGTNAANWLTYDGVSPFVNDDITVPNPVYWNRMDAFVDLAAAYGMTVVWGCATSDVFNGSPYFGSTGDCQAFGQLLGNAFKGKPNVAWLFGVDYASTDWPGNDAKFLAVRTGIRAAGDNHLMTIQYHNNDSISQDNPNWSGKFDFEDAYSYRATYEVMYRAYNSSSGKPTFLGESNFEDENNEGGPNTSAATLRRQFCWTLTCGGAGLTYGRYAIWRLDSGWQSALTSAYVTQNQRLFGFVNGIDWHKLVPDQTNSLITSGAGTKPSSGTQSGGYVDPLESNYATGAYDPAGSLAIMYVPTTRTITVDKTKVTNLMSSYWVDASNATITTTATFSGNNVTSPGTNAAGQQDWLLVMEGGSSGGGSSEGKVLLNGQPYPVFAHDGSTWVEREVYFHDGNTWTVSK